MDEIRLNLGAGNTQIPGYVNLDRKTGQEVYPLAYEDGSVDVIRASHVLEHFPHEQIGTVIADWVRALRPGGCVKIAVPDFAKIADLYAKGVPINTQGYVMGSHVDGDDYHKALFDEEALREAMYSAGLTRIGRWRSEIQDCAALPISLNLCGYKPSGTQTRVENARMILASARFGPALHHKCAYDALYALGIPYDLNIGCFWGQNLCEKIEEALEKQPNLQYIITGDFDSVFTANDVMEMYRLMEAYQNIDALVPVQAKRGGDALPLFSKCADGEISPLPKVTLKGNVTPITTGHFGLTFFRADKLRAFPRPWRVGKPGSDGRWHKDKIDQDIDFWFNWRAAGFMTYLANNVRIGHQLEMLVWSDQHFQPVYQTVGDYMKNGAPPEVHP